MNKKNLQRELVWRIPSAINLPNILKRNPPKFNYKPDYLYYFIHVICDKMDYLDPSATDKWVHLHSDIMKGMVYNYKQYLNYLVSMRIILENRSYKVGKHSKGYRIAPSYYKGDVLEVPLIDNSNYMFKRKLKRGIFSSNKKGSKKGDHLSKWLNQKLKIDIHGARSEVSRLYTDNDQLRGKFKALRAIKIISDGNFYFNIDKNIGRFHSNLTNLKKELRNYITYDGKALVNLDIKNSQPLLSGILLDEKFYKTEGMGGKFSLSRFNSVNKLLNNKQYSKIISLIPRTIMSLKSSKTLGTTEFDRFLTATQKGQFYEEFFQILHPGKNMTKEQRKVVKDIIFVTFFSQNKTRYVNSRLRRPFKRNFPTVYKIFAILKQHDKRILSHILQRIESELIIEIITKRIAKERPALPIFTIHDSVATTVGNEHYVQRVMEQEILKATGLNATIGKEYWETVTQKDLKTQKPLANAA